MGRLVAILDELDADPQAEPWLGAGVMLSPLHHDRRLWATKASDDREQDVGDEGEVENEQGAEDDAGEPNLGAS